MKSVQLSSLMTEKEFQAQVVQAAKLLGWLVYHTYDSRRSQAGFPDLVMIKEIDASNSVCLIAELKSERGKLTVEQKEWLNLLSKTKGLFVFVWKPSNWPEIEAALR